MDKSTSFTPVKVEKRPSPSGDFSNEKRQKTCENSLDSVPSLKEEPGYFDEIKIENESLCIKEEPEDLNNYSFSDNVEKCEDLFIKEELQNFTAKELKLPIIKKEIEDNAESIAEDKTECLRLKNAETEIEYTHVKEEPLKEPELYIEQEPELLIKDEPTECSIKIEIEYAKTDKLSNKKETDIKKTKQIVKVDVATQVSDRDFIEKKNIGVQVEPEMCSKYIACKFNTYRTKFNTSNTVSRHKPNILRKKKT